MLPEGSWPLRQLQNVALLSHCCRSSILLLHGFPVDSLACAVASEADQGVLLVLIETVDRVAQTQLGIFAGTLGEGVVDARRPA